MKKRTLTAGTILLCLSAISFGQNSIKDFGVDSYSGDNTLKFNSGFQSPVLDLGDYTLKGGTTKWQTF